MDIERLKELKQRIESVHWEINGQIAFNLIYDLLPLVDEAIARQSVKSEDVQEAIEYYAYIAKITKGEESLAETSANLAITALQEHQPWIQKK